MDYPELFYGVNVGRIPEERRNLPPEVIVLERYPEPETEEEKRYREKFLSNSKGIERINVEKLEEIAEREDLGVFAIGEEYGCAVSEGEGYDPEQVHIGIPIKDNYVMGTKVNGKERLDNEGVIFDVKQIISLRENPSELIAKLKKIGLKVWRRELVLYGFTGVD